MSVVSGTFEARCKRFKEAIVLERTESGELD
jgi:hypothetical protein